MYYVFKLLAKNVLIPFEVSGLLIKSITQTISNKIKKNKGLDFLVYYYIN